jgi:hypothetical protein
MSVETAEYAAMMRRMLTGWERRLEDADIEDLAELVAFAPEVEAACRRAGWRIHEQGRSWTEIGDVLGTTRQAAGQRFRPGAPAR